MGFKVAIIGMACRFPQAPDLGAFWNNIQEGVDAISAYPMAQRWGRQAGYYTPGSAPSLEQTYCSRAGVVADLHFDPLAYGIVPREVEEAEADQFIMLDLARSALADAGIVRTGREKTALPAGVIVGRTMPIGPVTIRFLDRIKLLPQLRQGLRDSFPGLDPSQLDAFAERFVAERKAGFDSSLTRNLVPGFAAARLANRLNLSGPSYILDAACASSLVAIENAIMQLQLGRCDVMLAGGVHVPLTQGYWSMFTNIGALSRQEQIRPFDRGADGLLLGEGAGLVVLKPLAAALAHGDRIHAVIEGAGSCGDGRAESLLAPCSDGQVQAFDTAWRNAGMDPGRAGYIECHGTGMPRGDEVESSSLLRFFGPHMQGRHVALGSVKSMIGHTLGAAGIASVIKTACALRDGVLPPSLHCRELRADLAAQGFHVPRHSVPWTGAGRVAGVSAFGFGGINAHLVMSAPPVPARASVPVALALTSPALATQETVLALARPDLASLLADLDSGALHPGAGPCRLVLFDPTPDRMAKARRIAARGQPWRGKQDIFFTPEGLLGAGGKLAFLFPGLGNQVNPDFRELAQRFGVDLARLSAGGDDALVSTSLQTVFSTNTLYHVFGALGIAPDAIAGHSLGEWIACVSSGMIGAAQLEILIARLLALQDSVMGKGYYLVAVWAGADSVRALLAGIDGAAIAVDNCPGHCVICGSAAALEIARQRLRAQGLLSVDMGVEAASHTPFIRAGLQGIRPLVEQIVLSEPAVPIWSSSLAGPYPHAAAEVKEVIIDNMATPVRFRELVGRLYDDGFRVFLQVGNAGLSGFVADTLKGSDYMALDAGSAGKSSEQMLRRAAAGLFAEGKAIDFTRFGMCAQRDEAAEAQEIAAPAPVRAALMSLDGNLNELHAMPGLSFVAGAAASAAASAAGAGPATLPMVQSLPPGALAYTDLHTLSMDVFQRAQHDVLAAFGAASSRSPSLGLSAVPAPMPLSEAGVAIATPAAAAPEPLSAAPIDPHAVVHRQTIEIDHGRFPELYDHEIYQSHEGRPVAERSAVVPMTMMIELACALVSDYLPGCSIRAVHKAFSFRFVDVRGPLALEARIYRKERNLYAVVVEDRFSCQVEVADSLLAAPPPSGAGRLLDSGHVPPFPLQLEQIYRDRWLFHGPLYQGIKQLGPMDASGMTGVVAHAGGLGALVDSAFQVAGVWFCSHYDEDNVVLPLKVGKIEFFAPLAALRNPLDRYDCQVFTRRVSETEFVYDLELSRAGVLQVRVSEFTGRRFSGDPSLFAIFRTPERLNPISEQLEDGLFVFDLAFRSNWTRVMLTKSYLTGRETERVDGSKTMGQRNAVLRGMVAAKDGLKQWLAQHRGVDRLFPSEIEISHDEQGAPLGIVARQDAPLLLSISHKPDIAAVIVGGTQRVGIDVEYIEQRSAAFEQLNYDADEIAFFAAQPDAERAFWQTLFWTAKEAWGKYSGHGLAGAPRRIKVRDVRTSGAGWRGQVEGTLFHARRHQDGHVISWVREQHETQH
ncbi:type I polyketide synthase [Pseudoduganella ginsengisoli]|uniref:Acyltransferase domain-containing protein n=1 Tax=Pseudoduganella ginsengisoli TaxID=1462440 RepID=A0A6L6Q4T4_9BURK|nr:type I polyketide synthase [Pseudoduganella ginsengisoli]MTW04777.1 acyltransferase domain-containing protein [Pseudoduganella ginsengisoli]